RTSTLSILLVGSLPLFFAPHPAPTAISTLSLHDALPICARSGLRRCDDRASPRPGRGRPPSGVPRLGVSFRGVENREASERNAGDRKSTRLNSSHSQISYAVFCLKKKNKTRTEDEATTQG